MRTYILRKLGIYLLTFWAAVTLNWALPRFMPGDPVLLMVARMGAQDPLHLQQLHGFFERIFGLDLPIWQQYLNYWVALFRGDLGISVWMFPTPVADVITRALPFTLGLMIPSILLSWIVGNKMGAWAARNRKLDNTIVPVSYILTGMPFMWLAMLLAWAFGIALGWFPVAGGFAFTLAPSWSWTFVGSLVRHWVLPFLSLFIVQLGGWAIGMRNLIIYELEADYSNYMDALGAPPSLIRRYAFRNAVLPQVTGLALQLGTIVAGAVGTEIVFAYPGLGSLILNAVNSQDFFLLQGVMLFIVIGVLIANFIVDIVYIILDPRTRTGMQGATA